MVKLFLLIAAICAAAIALLCVKVLFGKKFVHTHVDGNGALNKQGIHCVQAQDEEARAISGRGVRERSREK